MTESYSSFVKCGISHMSEIKIINVLNFISVHKHTSHISDVVFYLGLSFKNLEVKLDLKA